MPTPTERLWPSEPELKSGAYKRAKAGEVVGQSGVEAAYDSVLDAGFLKARIPVDALGRIVGQLVRPKEKPAPTLQLSIDTSLQHAVAGQAGHHHYRQHIAVLPAVHRNLALGWVERGVDLRDRGAGDVAGGDARLGGTGRI